MHCPTLQNDKQLTNLFCHILIRIKKRMNHVTIKEDPGGTTQIFVHGCGCNTRMKRKKMQFDVDMEPTFRFSYVKCIDKQKDITMKQSCSRFTNDMQRFSANFSKSTKPIVMRLCGRYSYDSFIPKSMPDITQYFESTPDTQTPFMGPITLRVIS